jgi:hypothetical protein
MDAVASPRMGEGRGQGLVGAPTFPAPSAPPHDEALNTLAHVRSQSTHDSDGIRQQYTLCAVIDEAKTPQPTDYIEESPRISSWRGAVSVNPPRGTLRDLRFVVAGLRAVSTSKCNTMINAWPHWAYRGFRA